MYLVPPLAMELRFARSAVFAVVCVTATALGHSLMSGRALSTGAIALALGATTAAAWQLTARQRGMLTVTSATVLAQALLHTFFIVTQMRVSPSVGTAPMGMHHMDMPAMGTGSSDPLLVAHREMAASGHGMSLGMMSAHAVAAVICGLWLWRGEAATFQLLRSLSARLFAPLARAGRILTATGPASPLRSVPVDAAARPLHQAELRHSVSRRGPPRAPAFC